MNKVISANIRHASKYALVKIAEMYGVDINWYDYIPIVGYYLLRYRVNASIVRMVQLGR
jgi:hypothetical protein